MTGFTHTDLEKCVKSWLWRDVRVNHCLVLWRECDMDIYLQAYQSFRCLLYPFVWASERTNEGEACRITRSCLLIIVSLCFGRKYHNGTNTVSVIFFFLIWFFFAFFCDFGCQNHINHQINVNYVNFSMYWCFCYWLLEFLC